MVLKRRLKHLERLESLAHELETHQPCAWGSEGPGRWSPLHGLTAMSSPALPGKARDSCTFWH